MKTTVSEIATKLKKVKAFIPTKLDVVAGVLYDNGTLIASNADITIKTSVDTNSRLDKERFIIPPKAVDLIDTLPDGDIEISSDGKKIKIKSASVNSNFATVPADEQYPGENDTQITDWQMMIPNSQTFADNVKSVMHCCAATAGGKPIYTAIRFDVKSGEGVVRLVACDGFRMAYSTEKATADAASMSVSAKDLQKILGIAADTGITVERTSTKAHFATGEYDVYTKLISGEFLNYEAAFPKTTATKVYFEKNAIIKALERAIICISGTKTSLNIKSDGTSSDGVTTVHFIAHTADSDCDEVMSAVTPRPGEIDIDFNSKYLLDCFKASAEDQISFEYFGSGSPAVFECGELKQMILPARRRKNA